MERLNNRILDKSHQLIDIFYGIIDKLRRIIDKQKLLTEKMSSLISLILLTLLRRPENFAFLQHRKS